MTPSPEARAFAENVLHLNTAIYVGDATRTRIDTELRAALARFSIEDQRWVCGRIAAAPIWRLAE